MVVYNLKLYLRNVDYLHFVAVMLFFVLSMASIDAMASGIDVDRASWDRDRDRLTVRGDNARDNETVTIRYGEKDDNGAVIGTTQADGDGDWKFRITGIDPVPCDVTAVDSRDDDDKEVRRAPNDCSNDGGAPPPAAQCSDGIDNDGDGLTDFPADPGCADANDNDEFNASPPPVAQCSDGIDNDGDGLTDFPADPGCTDANDNDETDVAPPPAAQCNDGIDNDGDNLVDLADPGCANANDNDETDVVAPPIPNVSINSTSRNGIPGAPVSEQPLAGQAGFVLFSANDLGMHCGDFDTRISSVLPPFQVMHTQVIQTGSNPVIMTPVDGVEVVYSASSSPTDPILTGINSAGNGPVLSSMLANGSVYKTNFWDGARNAYDPFYPQGILPAFYPASVDIVDLGLPMPNVEQLFLGDGNLTATQQEMSGRFGPYAINDPLAAKLFTIDQPFFTSFAFGYTSEGVDWYESAGIPLTAFDDFGRENPWALTRVQAVSGGQTMASLDTVLPISGEANCGFCHGDTADGGNGAGTQALLDANIAVVSSLDDPEHGLVPEEVSREYAADLNLVRLHDLKHGSGLGVNNAKYTPDLEDQTPVVCQQCHYTPALDLAQLGPLGPENDGPLILNGVEVSPSIANGRDQIKNKSMSNVMHSNHATVTDLNGDALFPAMPPAVDGNGNLRDPAVGRQVMEATCYQCHPGQRTDCLRGAMATGGMLCQDCHGDMAQVGDDFTRNVSPANPGAFELASDFFTNPATPRVPWANEPTCGSCHTGDATDNMHGDPGTVGDPQDGIRLMQAYLSTDSKATPILPSNTRFAENTVPATRADGTPNPGAGNPMLYRVSKGHGGVFCEGCHGSTHGIWPNGNPSANDNVAAIQLQGHTGTIIECTTCHTGNGTNLSPDGSLASLQGPHGMHVVGETAFADGDHKRNTNSNACRECHGQNGEGTVLSRTAADRDFTGMKDGGPVAAGTPVTCTMCHGNKL